MDRSISLSLSLSVPVTPGPHPIREHSSERRTHPVALVSVLGHGGDKLVEEDGDDDIEHDDPDDDDE
eukprot:533345-Rhodomonas_salina.1